MNIRSYLVSATFGCVAALLPGVGVAQTPVITVMTFQSNEQGLGAQAAEALRSKLTDEFDSKDLTVVPASDDSTYLDQSGFSIFDPLTPAEERTLANGVNADMFISGTITHDKNGRYQLAARLVLPYQPVPDQPMPMQPLPVADGKDVGDMMKPVVRAIREAMKQLDGSKRCQNLVNQKPEAAVAVARSAVAEYPRATIARNCMARAYMVQLSRAKTAVDSARYADSALSVSQAILQYDSLNLAALQYNVVLFKVRGDTARERQALLSLVRADPDNTEMTRRVINSLAAQGRIIDALPLLKDMITKIAGDTAVLRLAFQVYTTAKDWQSVANVGAELAKADSNAADSAYFTRMSIAYDKLQQPQAAVDILAQATAKYPNNSYFWFDYANELQRSGQSQGAAQAYRRFISLDPKDHELFAVAYLSLGSLYDDMGASDSLYALVQRAPTIPMLDTTNRRQVANIALIYGNKLLQAATTAQPSPPGEKLRTDVQNAIKYLQLANQTASSLDAQFLMGVANFQIMQSAATDAPVAKSCMLSRLADQSLNDAKQELQAGMTKPEYQAQAQTMLGYLPKFSPAIASDIKKFCK